MSKKPKVFYGIDEKEIKEEKKSFDYEKKLVKSYTTVYNVKTKEYELLTILIDLEELTSEIEISKLRGADSKARALYEVQKLTNDYFVKG